MIHPDDNDTMAELMRLQMVGPSPSLPSPFPRAPPTPTTSTACHQRQTERWLRCCEQEGKREELIAMVKGHKWTPAGQSANEIRAEFPHVQLEQNDRFPADPDEGWYFLLSLPPGWS